MTAPSRAPATAPLRDGHEIELAIGGVTCASCVARVERRLNKLAGVSASVNLATERASVTYPDTVTPTDLVAQVEAAGYTASLSQPSAVKSGSEPPAAPDLRTRLVVSALLTLPVLLMAMMPALQFSSWQWWSLALATPVVLWGAAPFHRAAWVNARHGAATMDTLISLGTLAAYGWSLWALFVGEAGELGMTMPLSFTVERGAGMDEIYLEVASAVTVFMLAGAPPRRAPSAAPARRCARSSNSASGTWPFFATALSSVSPST